MNQISFKKLNGLTPTIESCTLKLIEELGELLQLIGKGQGMSGENAPPALPGRMIEEAFDVAQSAVTMIYTLADRYSVDVDQFTKYHLEKLEEKGYLLWI